jgi:leader peptidase (prepilin peptidase)/N-methyltransferase
MTIAIFFIGGLIIGSFLNVVVCRLELAGSLLGRSQCPHCKKKIRWYDNIPLLSFALLKTRCRDCGKKISWQYPAVEGFTGILFALVGKFFFLPGDPTSWPAVIFYLGIFSLFMIIMAYDFRFMEIPMIAVWLGVFWTVLYYLYADWINFDAQAGIFSFKIYAGALAGFGAFLFFFLLSAGSKEKWMGMGDSYVALMAGLTVGWPDILPALILAFSGGAVYGIILIALKKKTMKSQVPFAPFLAVGVFLAIFLPLIFPDITRWLWF